MSEGSEVTTPPAAPPTRSPIAEVMHTCVPAATTSAVQLLVTVVITGLVGHMGGTALYVRSVYLPLSLILTAITTGIAVPLQVAVARSRHGKAIPPDQSARIGSSARLAVLAFTVLAVLVALAAAPLAALSSMPASLAPELRHFSLLMVVAQLVGAIGELSAATLRGLGRATLGTLVSITLAAVNVGLVALIGLALSVGLDALPIASALAGVVELALGAVLLTRCHVLRPPHLARWDPTMVPTTLQIGLPIAASFLVLFLNSVVMLHVVGAYGDRSTLEGFSSALTVQDLVTIPAVGFGSGIAVLVNARTGHRVSMLRHAFAVLVGTYAVITIVVVAAAAALVDLLLPAGAAAAHATHYLHVVGPSLGLTAIAIAALTTMEEVGLGAWSVALNLTFLVGVIAVGWIAVAASGTLDGLYITILVAGLIAGLLVPPFAYHKVARLALP
ncbi:MATE family efflux transporter [Nocardioides sp.]|uniref:MATE family efflux transporter n=1 Tax=Nocardioides sp. TaxID=35761 RepID=UPI002636309F|nr:MATE family efflux transporter [Nocardioides sp.]